MAERAPLAYLPQDRPPYLFGVIGLQGVALMMAEGVDFFEPRQLAVVGILINLIFLIFPPERYAARVAELRGAGR